MTETIFAEGAEFAPFWWEAAAPEALAEAPLPREVDVAVVGAGFTGLSAALELVRAGRGVLVLDSDRPGEGASTRNGGMIGSGHRVGLGRLTRRYGRQTALRLLEEGLAAQDFTMDLIAREQIACHLVRSGRFRGAWRAAHYDAMGREIETLQKAIGLEAEMVPRAEQHREIASDAYHGGVVYHRHGGLHPGLFHSGLMRRVLAAGGTVAGSAPVAAIAHEGGRLRLDTARGRVSARDVVVATNGYTGPLTPGLRRRLIPVPSYMIATEPLPGGTVERLIPARRMIVESRRRHCYYRPSPDGLRILFGGRASLTTIEPRAGARILHRLVIGVFPELSDVKVTHAWRGFVAFSRDMLPHLGRHDGLHYALGYNGSGVAMAPYLGHKIALQVLGRPEGRSPFDATPFPTIPFYTGRPWFLPALELAYRWRDRREGSW
jgi:glycine/D-amino acid oxidase-like deaminating enzyme